MTCQKGYLLFFKYHIKSRPNALTYSILRKSALGVYFCRSVYVYFCVFSVQTTLYKRFNKTPLNLIRKRYSIHVGVYVHHVPCRFSCVTWHERLTRGCASEHSHWYSVWIPVGAATAAFRLRPADRIAIVSTIEAWVVGGAAESWHNHMNLWRRSRDKKILDKSGKIMQLHAVFFIVANY